MISTQVNVCAYAKRQMGRLLFRSTDQANNITCPQT